MSAQTILVVEDDAKIRTLLRNVFEAEGFAVLESTRGQSVLDLIRTKRVSLVTLDIHLGSENGLDLARQIRRVSSVPIIMVTGQDDVIDRVAGLEIGADDYITKPFHIREVIARVRSVLRRAAITAEVAHSAAAEEDTKYIFDGMTADPDRLALVDRVGKDCGLTSGDFKLLMVFLKHPKRVLSRDQLMDLTGGREWNPLDRAIDNQVARLRKKIEHDPAEPRLIKTVRGIGYTFSCDVQVLQSSGSSAKSA
ncbi:DNA-binding response regulator [Aliiroseovarius zhejiangensis]|uniref:DNA-binding response regulator n=1 Tax=Aliiroseovarius zhejiangensis TaxID=1632025 RepID=A0ABQ3IN81_9RHOB|nr:response regulator transcription factor [Aliiroseovarius zhejiangensis]GHE85964.1 DNA-binding response regulator [Aliiroseovarius zhejiangensis]